jgi:hypothetical protein
MSIIPGRSSSYLNYTTRASDCGQGNCNEKLATLQDKLFLLIYLTYLLVLETVLLLSLSLLLPPASSTVIVMSTNSPTGGGTIDFREEHQMSILI